MTSESEAPTRYVLDANVFMQAARQYYAFDLAPAFWQALIAHADDGRIMSIDRVMDEIDRGKDALTDWANDNFHEWFVSTDEGDVIGVYARLMAWAQQQGQYTDAAKAEFARQENADPWLAAYAQAKGYTVVTDELLNPNVRRRIPLPNVCEAFDIPYMGTFALLRALGVRLG